MSKIPKGLIVFVGIDILVGLTMYALGFIFPPATYVALFALGLFTWCITVFCFFLCILFGIDQNIGAAIAFGLLCIGSAFLGLDIMRSLIGLSPILPWW